MMLTKQQREAIEQRDKARTQGEWLAVTGEDGGIGIEPSVVMPDDDSDTGWYYIATLHTLENDEDDAAFIAACSLDIPALLQTCDELEKRLFETERQRDHARRRLADVETKKAKEPGITTEQLRIRELQGNMPKLEHKIKALHAHIKQLQDATHNSKSQLKVVKVKLHDVNVENIGLQVENKRLREALTSIGLGKFGAKNVPVNTGDIFLALYNTACEALVERES